MRVAMEIPVAIGGGRSCRTRVFVRPENGFHGIFAGRVGTAGHGDGDEGIVGIPWPWALLLSCCIRVVV